MENRNFEFKESRLVDKKDYYLYFMTQSELKKLREYFAKDNKIFCPILKKEIDLEKSVVDHQHKLKSEEPDKDKGQVRAIMDFRANAMAGKIENMYKRYGFHKEGISLPELLRNIADYLESEPIKFKRNNKDVYLIHPSEKPLEKKIGKREFKKFKEFLINKYPNRKSLKNLEYFSKIPKKFKKDYEEFKEKSCI